MVHLLTSMECMGVASGCGEQEVCVASGSGWNLWVWLVGVVVRRYIVLIPTPLVSVLFCRSVPTFVHLKNIYREREKVTVDFPRRLVSLAIMQFYY